MNFFSILEFYLSYVSFLLVVVTGVLGLFLTIRDPKTNKIRYFSLGLYSIFFSLATFSSIKSQDMSFEDLKYKLDLPLTELKTSANDNMRTLKKMNDSILISSAESQVRLLKVQKMQNNIDSSIEALYRSSINSLVLVGDIREVADRASYELRNLSDQTNYLHPIVNDLRSIDGKLKQYIEGEQFSLFPFKIKFVASCFLTGPDLDSVSRLIKVANRTRGYEYPVKIEFYGPRSVPVVPFFVQISDSAEFRHFHFRVKESDVKCSLLSFDIENRCCRYMVETEVNSFSDLEDDFNYRNMSMSMLDYRYFWYNLKVNNILGKARLIYGNHLKGLNVGEVGIDSICISEAILLCGSKFRRVASQDDFSCNATFKSEYYSGEHSISNRLPTAGYSDLDMKLFKTSQGFLRPPNPAISPSILLLIARNSTAPPAADNSGR